MMLELFQDGKLIVRIEPVGNVVSGDFTFLPQSMARGCQLNAESFDDLFHSCLKKEKIHTKAYDKAEEIHEQWFGDRKYSDYDSFRISKAQRLKK